MSIQDNCRLIMNNGLGQTIRHYHVHIISGNTVNSNAEFKSLDILD